MLPSLKANASGPKQSSSLATVSRTAELPWMRSATTTTTTDQAMTRMILAISGWTHAQFDEKEIMPGSRITVGRPSPDGFTCKRWPPTSTFWPGAGDRSFVRPTGDVSRMIPPETRPMRVSGRLPWNDLEVEPAPPAPPPWTAARSGARGGTSGGAARSCPQDKVLAFEAHERSPR
jgi:hypothetical protein